MTTADPVDKRGRAPRKLNRLDQAAASIFYMLTGILLGAQLVHRYEHRHETLLAFGLMFGAFAAIYFTVFRPVKRPQRDGPVRILGSVKASRPGLPRPGAG